MLEGAEFLDLNWFEGEQVPVSTESLEAPADNSNDENIEDDEINNDSDFSDSDDDDCEGLNYNSNNITKKKLL